MVSGDKKQILSREQYARTRHRRGQFRTGRGIVTNLELDMCGTCEYDVRRTSSARILAALVDYLGMSESPWTPVSSSADKCLRESTGRG